MTFYDRRRIVSAMAPLLLVLGFVEVLGGQVLKAFEPLWAALPWLLVAFPAINAVGGNIASVVSSRLSSALHTGAVEPSVRAGIGRDGLLGAGLGLVTYGVLAFLILVQARALGVGPEDPMNLVAVVLLAGLLLTATLLSVAAVTSVVSFHRGLDPDDLVVPLVTTLGDFAGIAYLFVAHGLLQGVVA